MNFDLSDWEKRKLRLAPVLESAAAEGLVSAENKPRLLEFMLGRGLDIANAPQAQGSGLDAPRLDTVAVVEESEAPRFIRGFHDILITIGIVVALVGLGGLLSIFAVVPATILLAEILVRRQRLALPAVVLTVAFSLATVMIVTSWFGDDLDSDSWQGVGIFVAVAAMSGLFYWRYQVPLALAAALVSGFTAAVYALSLVLPDLLRNPRLYDDHPLLIAMFLGLLALLLFGTALRFDIADRERITRRSDVAFWIHLAAAPAILYAILSTVFLGDADGWFSAGTNLAQAGVVLAAVLVLMLTGIVLDRRAFVTSGLLSLGYAFQILLTEGGFEKILASTDRLLFVVMLAIGVIVLTLGIGWQALRRLVVRQLPEALQAYLPRTQ